MTIEERESEIKEFVQNIFSDYESTIKYDIFINDDSDPDATAFEVNITNSYNKKHLHIILNHLDYEGGIEVLKGEDFYSTDENDFIMFLFLSAFI